MAFGELDDYLNAADRESTLRSYAGCIRHFEQEWKGLLPATGESVARYIAAYAPHHALSTLRQRLAALARWHADHGFADPTRSPVVRKVLRGVRATHTTVQRQAKPLELAQLERVNQRLVDRHATALGAGNAVDVLRLTRDRSLLLLGFWRAFRSDELTRMQVEDVEVVAGKGLTCRLHRSKGDREFEGRTFHCPALSRLCAVEAYSEWTKLLGRTAGPVFPAIDRWGHISDDPMQATSLIPLLRGLFEDAGLEQVDEYTSHSLRRGFAGWAKASGWDLKDLMAYVGWKDVESAMRYLDGHSATLQQRFERGLT
jgi:integrase